MHVMFCIGSGHCSVLVPVTSVKDTLQLPVELTFPDAAIDALAAAGANGTGTKGVTGDACSSPSLVSAGRAVVPIITAMCDTMPVAALFASLTVGWVASPQRLQLASLYTG